MSTLTIVPTKKNRWVSAIKEGPGINPWAALTLKGLSITTDYDNGFLVVGCNDGDLEIVKDVVVGYDYKVLEVSDDYYKGGKWRDNYWKTLSLNPSL